MPNFIYRILIFLPYLSECGIQLTFSILNYVITMLMPKNENLKALLKKDSAILISFLRILGEKEIFWSCLKKMIEENILDIKNIEIFELFLFEFNKIINHTLSSSEGNTIFNNNFKMIFGLVLSVNENLDMFMKKIGFECLVNGGYLVYEVYIHGIELQFQKGNIKNVKIQIEKFIKKMFTLNSIAINKKMEVYNLVARFLNKNPLFAIDYLQEIKFDKIYLASLTDLTNNMEKKAGIGELFLDFLRPLFSMNSFYGGYFRKSLIPKNIYAALFSKTFEFFDFSITNDYFNIYKRLDLKNSEIFLEKAFKYLCSNIKTHKIDVKKFVQWAAEFTRSVKHTPIKYFNYINNLLTKKDLHDDQIINNLLTLVFKTIKSSNCYFEDDTQPLNTLKQIISITILKNQKIFKLIKRITHFFTNHITFSLLGSDYSFRLKLQDFTLCFWLKYNSLQNFKSILHLEGTSNYIAHLNISNGKLIFLQNEKDLKVKQWHFFTLAKFNSVLYIFCDGKILFESIENSNELIISFFKSSEIKISFPQVFNRALKYEEILSIFYEQSVRKFKKGCVELNEKELNIYNDNFENTFEFFNSDSISQSERLHMIPFNEALIQFNWLEKMLAIIERNTCCLKQLIVFWIDCYNDLAEKIEESYSMHIIQKLLNTITKKNPTKKSKAQKTLKIN